MEEDTREREGFHPPHEEHQEVQEDEDEGDLHHTRDYQAVAAAVEQLRRQRKRALHDIARLALLRERALAAPVPFVLRLKRPLVPVEERARVHSPESDEEATKGRDEGQEDIALPQRQKIVRLPRLDLRRYAHAERARTPAKRTIGRRQEKKRKDREEEPTLDNRLGDGVESASSTTQSVPDLFNKSSEASARPDHPSPPIPQALSRSIKQEPSSFESDYAQEWEGMAFKQEGEVKAEPTEANCTGSDPHSAIVIDPKPGDMVRGRVWDEYKPSSFNKLWNPEEQRRLEQLLLEIPEEEVAAHRWAKIARALGNRTPRQVASRVQKYFIKLARAGLPVPGKPPNLDVCLRKRRKTSHTEASEQSGSEEARSAYYTPPPVQMPDEDAHDNETENRPSRDSTTQQQQQCDDEDYRTYRSRASNYLDPAFMPS